MGINEKVDALKDELVKATQEVVRVKSVQEDAKEGMPFGEGPAKALACALEISKRLGFKAVNLDNYVGYAEYGEGEDYVGILGHLDVVPEGDGWKYAPYAAEIHDGKIYGRGTTDDKGPVMAALFGLKAVVDAGIPLNKRVRIIFGTNEETGSKEIEYYLEKEKPPVIGFTPDASYPLINGEKGMTVFDLSKELKVFPSSGLVIKNIKGGLRPNMVPDYCEADISGEGIEKVAAYAEEFSKTTGNDVRTELNGSMVKVKAYGVAAHGSIPEAGKNAVMILFSFLEKLPFEKCDVLDYIKFFNKYVGMESHGESFGVCLEDEVSGKLSFNVGVVTMTSNKISLTLNLRYPVTCKFEDMESRVNARISGTGIVVENMSHQLPLYFDENHPLVQTLLKVYSEQTGLEGKAYSIGGGTYAKEMPNIVAFGPIFPGKPDLDHQTNEYIEVEDLVKNAKIYGHAIYELAK